MILDDAKWAAFMQILMQIHYKMILHLTLLQLYKKL